MMGYVLGVVCIIGCMSEKRSIRGTVVSKTKEGGEERLYHSQRNMVLIYSAQFYRQFLLICTPLALTVYHSDSMVKLAESRNNAHCAAFVPHSNCIVYAVYGSIGTTDIILWDYKASRIASRVSIRGQIEAVQASRRCLLLQSQEQLYVLHFPTLRPIYNGVAGNGFHMVCDISREGLTLAHSSEKKGEVVVRNFTNIETNKLLQDERSRRMTFNSRRGSMFAGKGGEEAEEEVKHEICIAAHSENVTIVRLSPNGYRLVSGSAKGTVLRLYSCLSGQLISQYHMSGQLSTILDLSFTPEGTAIACLNLANELNLFHTNMSELQLISETARRGCEIYQRENPKSLLFFLGWMREEWRYERPFSFFVLSTDLIESKDREEMERQREVKSEKKHSRQEISEIVEESVHLEMGSELVPSQVSSGQREAEDNRNKTVSNEMQLEDIVAIKTDPSKESPPKSKRDSAHSKTNLKPLRPMSLKKAKGASIKSQGLVRKASDMVITVRGEEKELQVRGVVHFCDATNLKILRSKYFYKLKYDPFNGGEMVESVSFNLLKHPTFRHIE